MDIFVNQRFAIWQSESDVWHCPVATICLMSRLSVIEIPKWCPLQHKNGSSRRPILKFTYGKIIAKTEENKKDWLISKSSRIKESHGLCYTKFTWKSFLNSKKRAKFIAWPYSTWSNFQPGFYESLKSHHSKQWLSANFL